jgi:transcriptional regulator with XRE-family HTH domain
MAALRPQRNLEFGRRLRLALKAANLTQKAVSDATGIRETTLSQYVTGASRPDPEEMTKVCAIIPGLTLDYLYADDRRTLQGWLLKNIEGLEEAERRLATIIQPKKARTPSTRRA